MLTKSFIIAALIAALMQCAPTASADDGGALHGGAHQGEAHQEDWAAALGSDLVRLGRIEWALRSAAVPHCRDTAAGSGLVLDSLDAYAPADRAQVRQALGVASLPTVLAVMQGSPAEHAGLQAGDTLLEIGARGLPALPRGSTVAEAALDAIEARPPGSAVSITVRRGENRVQTTMVTHPVCAARVFLKTENAIGAHSDGSNIAITTGTVRFAASDDEIALVLGHELAHTILHKGRPSGLFSGKAREDEADAKGAALAACAGYDIGRALAFWQRIAATQRAGLPRLPTHRSAASRLSRLRHTLPELVCPAAPISRSAA